MITAPHTVQDLCCLKSDPACIAALPICIDVLDHFLPRYDMFFDTFPHTDRHNREFKGPTWEPLTGP